MKNRPYELQKARTSIENAIASLEQYKRDIPTKGKGGHQYFSMATDARIDELNRVIEQIEIQHAEMKKYFGEA